MFFKKKAQGLPLSVIIIAIIAIVVLIVIIAIFVLKIRLLPEELSSCTGKGGECKKEPCSKYGLPELKSTDCEKLDKSRPYCCLTYLNVT